MRLDSFAQVLSSFLLTTCVALAADQPPNVVLIFADDQGYIIGGIGKWHMGTADHQHPDAMGYSDWFGFLGGGLMYYPLNHPS